MCVCVCVSELRSRMINSTYAPTQHPEAARALWPAGADLVLECAGVPETVAGAPALTRRVPGSTCRPASSIASPCRATRSPPSRRAATRCCSPPAWHRCAVGSVPRWPPPTSPSPPSPTASATHTSGISPWMASISRRRCCTYSAEPNGAGPRTPSTSTDSSRRSAGPPRRTPRSTHQISTTTSANRSQQPP